MLNSSMKKMLVVAFLSLAGIPSIWGQTAGSVAGHLADPAGASLAQTEVTLTDVDTTGVRTTKTTGAGDYTFPEVPPGKYTIAVKHEGFKALQSEPFEVQVQQSVRLDFTLQVGAATESITVEATGSL